MRIENFIIDCTPEVWFEIYKAARKYIEVTGASKIEIIYNEREDYIKEIHKSSGYWLSTWQDVRRIFTIERRFSPNTYVYCFRIS